MNPAVDIFRQAAELCRKDAVRKGNTLHLGSPPKVIFTGDIHGHRGNMNKIIAYFQKYRSQGAVLILQEIIHGPPDEFSGQDRSAELLQRAARLKLQFPEQVYILLGNHDIAEITHNEITKEGRGVCQDFRSGLAASYGSDAPDVYSAMCEMLRALPLAGRFDNGVLVAHSLPSPRRADAAGVDILERECRDADYLRPGPAYEWTWGRDQTPEQLDQLAEALDVNFFLLGHRHLDSGQLLLPNRACAVNCDRTQGCLVEFSGNDPICMDTLSNHIKHLHTL